MFEISVVHMVNLNIVVARHAEYWDEVVSADSCLYTKLDQILKYAVVVL